MLEVLDGRFELADNSGERVVSSAMIVPAFALRAGRRHAATSPVIPPPLAAAA